MTLLDISVLEEALRSLSIAPQLLMYSSRVSINCFPLFIGQASVTKVSLPTNTWACLTPLSTAGVSEKTVSVATVSCLLEMLRAGLTEFRQPLQVQSHLEMPGILVQLGHIQRT